MSRTTAKTDGAMVPVLTATEEQVRQLQAQVDQGVVLQDATRRIALDILAQRTGVDALQHIAVAARRLSGAQYAALGVAHPNGDGLQAFITTGMTPEEVAIVGSPPHGRGILGLLLTRTEPLRIANLSQHPNSGGFPPNHPPMTSFLGVPIRRGSHILGSFYVTDKENAPEFTDEDAATLSELAAHAAVAIHYLQMQERQRALLSHLIAAQEEERRAVAYDLHDGLTQYVMASQAHLEAFKRAHHKGEEERAERELEQGLRYLKEAVMESRRLVNGLRTLALDDLGVAGALEQLLNEEKERAGWTEAEFLHNIAGRRFDRVLETTLYRVAQEALTNIRKHAQARRVRLLLLLEPSSWQGRPGVTLEVRDWGRGFEPSGVFPGGTSFLSGDGQAGVGLHGMIERIGLLGGAHMLTSAPGSGTTVRAVFPLLEGKEQSEAEEATEA